MLIAVAMMIRLIIVRSSFRLDQCPASSELIDQRSDDIKPR